MISLFFISVKLIDATITTNVYKYSTMGLIQMYLVLLPSRYFELALIAFIFVIFGINFLVLPEVSLTTKLDATCNTQIFKLGLFVFLWMNFNIVITESLRCIELLSRLTLETEISENAL